MIDGSWTKKKSNGDQFALCRIYLKFDVLLPSLALLPFWGGVILPPVKVFRPAM
jgi:hypothetical protein